MTELDWFELKYTPEPNTGCWIWLEALNGAGYGKHRLSYELHIGHIEKGKQVLHSCDNKWCVNPKHLRIGTQLDNEKDKRAKGRQKYKLSHELREAIASEYKPGVTKQYDMAKKYGVSQITISRICSKLNKRGHKVD